MSSGHVRILIVGGGFAGLGAAVRLDRAGERDFVVIERGDDVGGTWRDNTYPGAACDVPSHLYSYSFALNPDWSRSFSPQWEIQDYLRRVAKDSGVLDRIRFDCELLDARWDADRTLWHVRTSQGDWTAQTLILAVGPLSEPRLPDIHGIDMFRGRLFHSARWDHDYLLRGRRVAVIGTGASAIQIVPEIAEQVQRLDVYQRTAPWIVPRRDRALTSGEKWAFRNLPGVQRAIRDAIYLGREMFVPGFAINPRYLRWAQQLALRHMRRQVTDPVLRAQLTPDYVMGCKRILVSNDWYPAIQRSNVELVTSGIREIASDAIVLQNGQRREVDAIVVATGFHVTDSPVATRITGANGRTLAEHWADGMQAYLGTTVSGFPNCFYLIGPNTGLGHSSMVFMIESQLNYVIDALQHMTRFDLATLEVRRDAQDAYNQRLQESIKETVWSAGGCMSWYQDSQGRVTTQWPGFTFRFWWLTRRFDAAAYRSTAQSDTDIDRVAVAA